MKMGILTFHRPINFGAALQAVATYQYLSKETTCEVELIDYRHERIERERKLIGSRVHAHMPALRILKSLARNCLDYRVEYNRRMLFDRFVQAYTHRSAAVTDATIQTLAMDYDYLLVGSDLVWNWELDRQLNPVFFLQFHCKEDAVKISYASSIGSSQIPKELENRYKSMLSNIDYISVRERTACKLLETLTTKKVFCAVDPTLLLTSAKWRSMEVVTPTPERYIFVYCLEQTAAFTEVVTHIAETMNIDVVYFGKKRQKHGGQHTHRVYGIGPEQFLYLIDHAEVVITNSFHGTSFSLLFNTPFISVPHSTRGSRMMDFLSEVGQSYRCCHNWKSVDVEHCCNQIESSTYDRLSKWIEESKEYLRNAGIQ